MALAAIALTVLVVLPLTSLLLASVTEEGRADPRPLPRGAVPATLRPGPQELADPGRLDGAPERRRRAAHGLGGEPHRRAGEAVHPRHGDDRVPHAALPHRDRVREPLQPERGARQPVGPRRAGPAAAHVQHPLDGRAGPGHGAPHVPVRVPAGGERARVRRRVDGGVGPDPRGGAVADRAAPSPLPLVAPAILAGALVAFVNAIALFGSQAIIGLPGPHLHPAHADLRALRPPAAVRAGVGALAGLRRASPSSRSRSSAATWPGARTSPSAARATGRRSSRSAGRAGGRSRSASGSSSWRCSRRTSRSWPSPLSRSWGLDFWQNLTLAALPLHPLRVRRHPAGDREQPRASPRRPRR